MVAVITVEGRNLGRAGFVTEVAPNPEGTVRPAAATDTDTLAVTVQDLGLEALLDGPCLQSCLEYGKRRKDLASCNGRHDGKVRNARDNERVQFASELSV